MNFLTPEHQQEILGTVCHYEELELKFARQRLGSIAVDRVTEALQIEQQAIIGLSLEERLHMAQQDADLATNDLVPDEGVEGKREFFEVCNELFDKTQEHFGDIKGWRLATLYKDHLSLRSGTATDHTQLSVWRNSVGMIEMQKGHYWTDIEVAMGLKAEKQNLAVTQRDIEILGMAVNRLQAVNTLLEEEIQ